MKILFIKNNSLLRLLGVGFAVANIFISSISAQTTANLTPTDDTYITNAGANNKNYGTCTYFSMRETLTKSILLFDLSAIPSSAIISSATLKLNGTTVSAMNVSAYRITSVWSEGTLCDSGGSPNWSTPWTTPGGDYDPTAVTTTAISAATGIYNWDLTGLTQNWVDGTHTNFGVLFDPDNVGTEIIFDSKEGTVPPVLEIIYSTLELSTTQTNESCTGAADGTIDLTVTNGTTPITYAWSDGGITTQDRTSLVAGSYTVTVTDANESKSISTTIGSPTAMNLTTTATAPSSPGAADGAINLTIEDGTAPFSFLWSNGVTTEDLSGLDVGTYSVTVTDDCLATASISATVADIAQKYLYLTDPSQGLDRIDPMAAGDGTISSTATFIAEESGVVADNFDTNGCFAGTNSTGSLDWASPWDEVDGAGAGAGAGGVQVVGNSLQIYDSNSGLEAFREVDLSSVSTAVFSFDFVNAMNHASDEVTIEISKDGGVTYPFVLAIFDQNTTNGNKVFSELVASIGALTATTRIRFRVSNNGGAGNNYSTYDNIQFAYTKPGTASQTFTQSTPMCSDLTIDSSLPITVTAYATTVSGTTPANPNIEAILRYGATNIITLTNPTYSSGTGLITWTGTLGAAVTIPAGQAVSLDINSSETAANFNIDFDSNTKPSKIQIPTTTYINVDALAVYDAPYSGGSIITSADAGTTSYIRAVISDPFGFDDITGMNIEITDPSSATSTVSATSVATAGCTRTYEYAWTSPTSPSGDFSLKAIANEGTEGVTANSTTIFEVISPVKITKTLLTPATAPYTVGTNLSYQITIDNQGTTGVTTLPLQDIFSESCLSFISAAPAENTITSGKIIWTDLGPLAGMTSTSVTVNMTVIGNCDPADNIALVQGAIDANSQSIALFSDTLSLIIDETPVANDDKFCVSGIENLDVLANDIDPDNDLTTVTITVPPSVGGAGVNPDNTIKYSPSVGMVDNDQTTFTYQVCDNASVTPFCSTAVVTVVFSTVNDAPTPMTDYPSTTLDLPFTFSVTDNDTDIDGSIDPTSLTITTAPNFGSATAASDGTIYYVPNPGFSGVDQLTYQVCDNGCPTPVMCATATVNISVIYVQYFCTSSTSDTLRTVPVDGAVSYTWTLPVGATIISLPVDSNKIAVDWSGVSPGQYSMCVLATNDCGDGTQICQDIVVNELVLTTLPTDILCASESTGAIDLTVSGGIPAFDYNWNNGLTVEDLSGIPAGSYNVTVTDKYGCIASANETLTEPASVISLTGTVTDENPYGTTNGAIDISPSGGTTPYTFSWSNGSINEDLTGLSGGTYTVTVTDLNGCSIVESFTVNTIGGPFEVSSIIATDALCNGGSDGTIDLEIIGGSGTYTYDWDYNGTGGFTDPQDLSGLTAGTYNVTISDGVNPNITTSATVNQPATAVAAATTGTNVSCNGDTDGAVDLTASGGTAPLTFAWSTGETTEDIPNLGAGTYDVTVTDANGCFITDSQTITEPPALVASGITTDTPCDPSNSGAIDLSVSGGAPAYTFAWSNGATTEDISSLTAGNYAVTITDANLCTEILSFTINSVCIGAAKTISAGPINNNDGTYSLTYDIKIKNEGDVNLTNIQVVENLSTTFSGSTGFMVDLIFSSDFEINELFTGTGSNDLLGVSQNLIAGDSGLVQIMVTITPGTKLGIYNNSVSTSAQSDEGVGTTDISQDGTETDPEGDGPTDNSVPTPVSFTENPIIGVAKSITNGPINNGDGTYDLTYQILVRNMGDVPLNAVQVSDTLSNTFSRAPVTVTSLTSPDLAVNLGYDGTANFNLLAATDVMQINEIDTIILSLQVTLGSNLGVHNNTAIGEGTSPSGTDVTDDSQDGSDVDPTDGSVGLPDGDPTNDDVPTPVTFPESPEIGVAKKLVGTPINNTDGSYTLTYQFLVKNTGDVPLTGVLLTDNLTTTFSGAPVSVNNLTSADMSVNFHAGYDGTSDFNLLDGSDSMLPGEQDTVVLIITVTPGSNLGVYDNSASATGTSPGGTDVTDLSHDGAQVDPENDGTSDNSTPTPVSFTENPSVGIAKTISSPAVSNNDGSYTLTYQLLVKNYGDVPLVSVQITEDLDATFVGSTSYSVTNVTSPDMSVNFPSFDGSGTKNLLSGSDQILVGEQDTVYLTVTVTPGAKLGIYYNSVTVNATGPGGTAVSDDSYDGTESDPDSNGDPTDNTLPTPVTFVENPQLGVAKVVASSTDNLDGTYTVIYDIKIENAGDVPLTNIHVVDNMAETFLNAVAFSVTGISSTDFIVNSSYDGDVDIEMLSVFPSLAVGASGIITVTVLVTPGDYIKPFLNKAASYGTTPSTAIVLDNSTNGTDVDPDSDGNTGNNSVPTPVQFPTAIIGAAKAITSGPTLLSEGLYQVTYQMKAANLGAFDLYDVQLFDTLTVEYGSYVVGAPTTAGSYTISSAPVIDFIETGSVLTANSSFTGSAGNTELLTLSTGDILEQTDSVMISFTIDFRPRIAQKEFYNQIKAFGDKTETGVADGDATDLSDWGTLVDEDGDGIPTEDLNNVEDDSPESDPTYFMIDYVPTANNDYDTTQVNVPVNILVLANDTFGIDGPILDSISIQLQPQNGTAVVNDGGTPNDPTDDTIDYTPNLDFSGRDTFIYEICDLDLDCDTAFVYLLICPELTGTETYTGCASDGYSATVNGTIYNEANSTGSEMLVSAEGCDSLVMINLVFQALPSFTLTLSEVCPDDNPTVLITLGAGADVDPTVNVNSGSGFAISTLLPVNTLEVADGLNLSANNSVKLTNASGCNLTENINVPGIVARVCLPLKIEKMNNE